MRLRSNNFIPLFVVAVTLGACATKPPASCSGLGPVTLVEFPTADGSRGTRLLYPPNEDRVARLTCEADGGNQQAARELAVMFETGSGVSKDEQRAVGLYQRAAATVAPVTQVYAPPVRLGGSGSVLILPNSGATRGDAEAQYRLALMYLDGRGVAPNPSQARSLLELAARQDHAGAQKALLQISETR